MNKLRSRKPRKLCRYDLDGASWLGCELWIPGRSRAKRCSGRLLTGRKGKRPIEGSRSPTERHWRPSRWSVGGMRRSVAKTLDRPYQSQSRLIVMDAGKGKAGMTQPESEAMDDRSRSGED